MKAHADCPIFENIQIYVLIIVRSEQVRTDPKEIEREQSTFIGRSSLSI